MLYAIITVFHFALNANEISKPNAQNVLYIVVDDLNTRVSPMGDLKAFTPNLERLANRGVLFSQAYAQYSVCGPSRASFLSGLRPETGQVLDNGLSSIANTPAGMATQLPEVFRKAGYFCARIGKVYHTGYDLARCWDFSSEATENGKPMYSDREENEGKPYAEAYEVHPEIKYESPVWGRMKGPESLNFDWRVATKAMELIEEASDAGKPFFVAAGFHRPHLPWYAPEEAFKMFDQVNFPELSAAFMNPEFGKLESDDFQEAMRAYYASIAYFDEQLGRLIDKLDEKNLWENTIVVLLGDNGYELGERSGYWGKGDFFAVHSRVPVIVAAPGVPAGQVCNNVIELIDLYPTICDLAGLPVPESVEGKSLVSMLEKPAEYVDSVAVTIRSDDGWRRGEPNRIIGHCIRDARWTFIQSTAPEFEELDALYDRTVDPLERNNLIKTGHTEVLSNMRKRLADYLRRSRIDSL